MTLQKHRYLYAKLFKNLSYRMPHFTCNQDSILLDNISNLLYETNISIEDIITHTICNELLAMTYVWDIWSRIDKKENKMSSSIKKLVHKLLREN